MEYGFCFHGYSAVEHSGGCSLEPGHWAGFSVLIGCRLSQCWKTAGCCFPITSWVSDSFLGFIIVSSRSDSYLLQSSQNSISNTLFITSHFPPCITVIYVHVLFPLLRGKHLKF